MIGELASFDAARASKSLHGEDRIIFEPGLYLYGVIDGMGGPGNGDIAAELSKQAIIGCIEENRGEIRNPQMAAFIMKMAFEQAQQSIKNRIDEGGVSLNMGAVGTVLHFYKNDRLDGAISGFYGHVGDTRLYQRPSNTAEVRQVTNDEEYDGKLINALIAYHTTFDQFGGLSVDTGDRFMICSDGIIGKPQLGADYSVSNDEIVDALAAKSARSSVKRLIKVSKKVPDDRSVVVIDVR